MKTEEVIDKDLQAGDKAVFLQNQPDAKMVILKVISTDSEYVTMKIFEGDGSLFKFHTELDGSIKFRINGNRTYTVIKSPIFTFNLLDFIMGNLEFYPLMFSLLYFYHVPFDWRLWVTILSVSFCAGISSSYYKRKTK